MSSINGNNNGRVEFGIKEGNSFIGVRVTGANRSIMNKSIFVCHTDNNAQVLVGDSPQMDAAVNDVLARTNQLFGNAAYVPQVPSSSTSSTSSAPSLFKPTTTSTKTENTNTSKEINAKTSEETGTLVAAFKRFSTNPKVGGGTIRTRMENIRSNLIYKSGNTYYHVNNEQAQFNPGSYPEGNYKVFATANNRLVVKPVENSNVQTTASSSSVQPSFQTASTSTAATSVSTKAQPVGDAMTKTDKKDDHKMGRSRSILNKKITDPAAAAVSHQLLAGLRNAEKNPGTLLPAEPMLEPEKKPKRTLDKDVVLIFERSSNGLQHTTLQSLSIACDTEGDAYCHPENENEIIELWKFPVGTYEVTATNGKFNVRKVDYKYSDI